MNLVCVCGVDYRRTVCSGFSIQANWPKPCYIACYCQTVAAAVAPTYGLCAKYAFGHFGKCCLIYSVHCVQLPAISREFYSFTLSLSLSHSNSCILHSSPVLVCDGFWCKKLIYCYNTESYDHSFHVNMDSLQVGYQNDCVFCLVSIFEMNGNVGRDKVEPKPVFARRIKK